MSSQGLCKNKMVNVQILWKRMVFLSQVLLFTQTLVHANATHWH